MVQIDPRGWYTRTEYDDAGNPTRISDCKPGGALVAQTSSEYDSRGLMTSKTVATEISEGGVVATTTETCEYDGLGQLVGWTDELGAGVSISRDGLGRIESQDWYLTDDTDARVTEYRVEYDLDDRGNIEKETHQVLNSLEIVGAPTSFEFTRTYDKLDRLESEDNAATGTVRYEYDQQSNIVKTTRPDSTVVHAQHDSLGRPLNITRPEGISTDYTYTEGANSSQVEMTDGRQNRTQWSYDGQGLLTSIEYPGSTSEGFEYDVLGNLKRITRRDGAVLDQEFDELGRLKTVARGGEVLESFSYDLEPDTLRSLIASRGATTTKVHLDARGLPKFVSSKVGATSANTFDISNSFSLRGLGESIAYPSSPLFTRTYDSRDQLAAVSTMVFESPEAEAVPEALASYQRFTPEVMGRKSMSSLEFEWTPDEAGRPTGVLVKEGQTERLRESLVWKDGYLSERSVDEPGGSSSWSWQYDDAGRLEEESATYSAAVIDAVLGGSESFTFDSAENLTRREYRSACGTVDRTYRVEAGNQLAIDSSSELAWDDNGNLSTRGDLKLFYDHEDRLIRVQRNESLIGEYSYDAFGRRVQRTVDGIDYATVWDGWRPIEEYRRSGENWLLTHRQVHGDGLDEIIGLEVFAGGDVSEYRPIYDTSGNLTVLMDSGGRPIERYFYTPFGERWVLSRGELPKVEQVRIEGGAILVELSEQVSESGLEDAIQLVGPSGDLNIDVGLVGVEGRMNGRRIRIALRLEEGEAPPSPGTELTLTVEGSGLVDTFDGTPADEDTVVIFPWGGDGVVLDVAAPELEEACLDSSGKVRLVFSEPLRSGATGVLSIDGNSQTWSTSPDGYTLTSAGTFTTGSHTLQLTQGEFDLAGNSLPETSIGFTGSTHPSLLALTADASLSRTSQVGNPFGFHGLQHDAETGFVYARNRFLDPELGRFTTTDPLGYVDGPNLYQFALNNSVNFSDPMGLYTWGQAKRDAAFGFEFYLAASDNLYNPRNLWRNTQRGLGGVAGEVRLVGGTAFSLAQLYVDNPVGGVPSPEGMMRNIERAQALSQTVSHPLDAVADSWNEMVASVEAHEAAGEYFSSGAVAGEWGANAGLVVIGGAELAFGATRLAASGTRSLLSSRLPATRGLVPQRGPSAARLAEYRRFRSQGHGAAEARKLTELYDNGSRAGHHFPVPQRTANSWNWPAALRDSPLNVLKPRGMNIGRFYELHYRVDPYFHGASLGSGLNSWRGSALGLTRAQGLERLWLSTPGPLKLTIGAGSGGAAAAWWWFDG